MTRRDYKRPSAAYNQLVGLGEIDRDPAQLAVLSHLDQLCDALAALPSRKAGLGWLFGRKPVMPRGLYLWGSVGRGKTMLMDLMVDYAPIEKKIRLHFQSFMADVHRRIHDIRERMKRGEMKEADPITPVAQSIAQEISLLCLDEFSVSDIADAMILGRLFKALFAEGIVLVTTSNIPPDHLYEGGLNRALFLPFIEVLKQAVTIVELDAPLDYRLGKTIESRCYFSPDTDQARDNFNHIFDQMTAGKALHRETLDVLGHSLKIDATSSGIARCSYDSLCKKPLGANDFIAIAERFHTVFIDHIPVIDPDNHNEAKRFIAMIDAFYDRSVKLYATAAAPPEQLYRAQAGRESFEFDRTVSRLIEMQSNEYHALPHGMRAVSAAL